MPREPLIRVLLDEHPVTGMGGAGYPPRGFDPARGSPGQARWFAISPQRGSQRYEPYGRWTPLRVSAQFFTNVSHTQTGNGGTKRGGPTLNPILFLGLMILLAAALPQQKPTPVAMAQQRLGQKGCGPGFFRKTRIHPRDGNGVGGPAMPLSFETKTLTVGELFSGSNVLRMPIFQRPY